MICIIIIHCMAEKMQLKSAIIQSILYAEQLQCFFPPSNTGSYLGTNYHEVVGMDEKREARY